MTKAIAHEDVAQRGFADLGEGKKREAMTVIVISVLVWLGSTAFAVFGSASGRPASPRPNPQSSSESETSPTPNPQSSSESQSSLSTTPVTDNQNELPPTNTKISKNFTGTYQRETGLATLKLLKLDNNHYKFEAFTEENQTTGQADGELTLNGATGTYKSPDSSGTVTVTLDQKTSSISLVAAPREAFCGMRCTLDGTYRISKSGVPSFHRDNWLAGEKIAKPDTFKDPDGSFSFQLPGGLFKLDGNGGVNKFGQGVYLHSVDDKASIEALSQVFNKAGLDASMQEEIAEHPEWKITMKKKGKDWYALSGYDNDMIFYSKTVITKNYDQIQFRIYFKKADRAKFAEATEMIAATFK
ncbi:MAG: hypothetical protein Q8T09_00615 [Candidatus Melainabacteria bacterium]|nr:hypothetical protein [Candidatus Melainabacteria bacterium]